MEPGDITVADAISWTGGYTLILTAANNIIVNYQAIPGDEGFTASSALRLGVSEMTRFGMKEKDFEAFAALFTDAVNNRRHVADEVARFREGFQTLQYCFDAKIPSSFKDRLLETF